MLIFVICHGLSFFYWFIIYFTLVANFRIFLSFVIVVQVFLKWLFFPWIFIYFVLFFFMQHTRVFHFIKFHKNTSSFPSKYLQNDIRCCFLLLQIFIHIHDFRFFCCYPLGWYPCITNSKRWISFQGNIFHYFIAIEVRIMLSISHWWYVLLCSW